MSNKSKSNETAAGARHSMPRIVRGPIPSVNRDDLTMGEKSAVQETIRKMKALKWDAQKAAEFGADRFSCNDSRIPVIRDEAISLIEAMEDSYQEAARQYFEDMECRCGSARANDSANVKPSQEGRKKTL